MNLIQDVKDSLVDYLGCEVDVIWVDKHEECNGYEVSGHYQIKMPVKGITRRLDVYSDNEMRALIPPYNKVVLDLLGSIKKSVNGNTIKQNGSFVGRLKRILGKS